MFECWAPDQTGHLSIAGKCCKMSDNESVGNIAGRCKGAIMLMNTQCI